MTLARLKAEAKRLDELAALWAECRALGITQGQIAAMCDPAVSRTHVCHVIAGRSRSEANVVAAMQRLRDKKRASKKAS